MTPEGHRCIQDELRQLLRVEHPKVVETVAWAHLGLPIVSNEHERPGFRDEIIIRRHRVHDPREEANPLRAR